MTQPQYNYCGCVGVGDLQVKSDADGKAGLNLVFIVIFSISEIVMAKGC